MKFALPICLALALSSSAFAAPKKAGPSAQCRALIVQYEGSIDTGSRYAALGQAIDDPDDYGFRSMVEQKQSNALSQAQIALSALKSAGCHAPADTVSADKYMPYARGCMRNRILSQYGNGPAAGCDASAWPKQKG